ncbi:MFS transporter [Phaeosphaeriaceae sp. PMI808]|nr:MFS transporter [Phaeosphaeriaceae sp. PMI808]
MIEVAEEARLLRKLDLHFVPVIMVVYLACFLDRANIGNVKVAGMPKDIGASESEISTAISIFYATYVAFELPWTLLLKKLTPRYLLTTLCIVWSVCTVACGFIENIGGLYAIRLILGACEAGLFPSLNLYLTMVYNRDEQAKRVAYLFVCTALSGAFGGLLAYAILKMDNVGGYAGWRWVFIIEGIFSFATAAAIWWGLPNDPSQAYFLTDHEKELMQIRERNRATYMGSERFDWREVRIALKDPKMWLSGSIQFLQDILLYGFSTFLPAIIMSMGYSKLQSQYLTIPVYLFGGACFIAVAIFSDRLLLRSPFLFFTNLFGIAGYILILCPTPSSVKFLGTFLCAIAVFNGPGLNLTWLNVNIAPHYRRAAAIGIQLSMGNAAGIVAGQIYRKSPYVLGNAFSVGALGLSQVLVAIKYFYIRSCNAKKAKIATGERKDTRKVKTGDWELDFKYQL